MEDTANSEEATYKIGRGKPPKDHQWKPGESGNPSGRPKNTMKDFMRRRFMGLSDEEKEEFLEGVPKVDQIKLAEGNPHNEVAVSGDITVNLVKYGADDSI